VFAKERTIPKAPATTGAFYFFNHPQSAKDDSQRLAPFPISTTGIEPFYLLEQASYIPTHSKARQLTYSTLQIHLSPQYIYQKLRPQSP